MNEQNGQWSIKFCDGISSCKINLIRSLSFNKWSNYWHMQMKKEKNKTLINKPYNNLKKKIRIISNTVKLIVKLLLHQPNKFTRRENRWITMILYLLFLLMQFSRIRRNYVRYYILYRTNAIRNDRIWKVTRKCSHKARPIQPYPRWFTPKTCVFSFALSFERGRTCVEFRFSSVFRLPRCGGAATWWKRKHFVQFVKGGNNSTRKPTTGMAFR